MKTTILTLTLAVTLAATLTLTGCKLTPKKSVYRILLERKVMFYDRGQRAKWGRHLEGISIRTNCKLNGVTLKHFSRCVEQNGGIF